MKGRAHKTAVARLLRRMGVDPFKEMVALAQDPETPPAVRAKLWTELANYCEPKLRSLELEVEEKPQLSLPLDPVAVREQLYGRAN